MRVLKVLRVLQELQELWECVQGCWLRDWLSCWLRGARSRCWALWWERALQGGLAWVRRLVCCALWSWMLKFGSPGF